MVRYVESPTRSLALRPGWVFAPAQMAPKPAVAGHYTTGMTDLPSASAIALQLGGMDLFAGLERDALIAVAAAGRPTPLAKGKVLFAQGASADRCHALIAGRVRIAQTGAEGGQLIVRFVGPGETFGTVALFTDRRYPAEAVAVVDSLEISWPEATLLELIQRYPPIALNLLRIVGGRLREVQERLREVATERAEQRIAHALLRLSEQHVTPESNDAVIEFPLTRQDVAEMCGVTLYTVSRVLTAWEKAGFIRTDRKRLTIREPAQIRALADGLVDHPGL